MRVGCRAGWQSGNIDFERGGQSEVPAECCQGHACGIGFPVGGISCDMRGADVNALQKGKADLRFVFPSVDDGVFHASVQQCLVECIVVCHRSAPGIDDDGVFFKSVEEGLVGQMVGGEVAGAVSGVWKEMMSQCFATRSIL